MAPLKKQYYMTMMSKTKYHVLKCDITILAYGTILKKHNIAILYCPKIQKCGIIMASYSKNTVLPYYDVQNIVPYHTVKNMVLPRPKDHGIWCKCVSISLCSLSFCLWCRKRKLHSGCHGDSDEAVLR